MVIQKLEEVTFPYETRSDDIYLSENALNQLLCCLPSDIFHNVHTLHIALIKTKNYFLQSTFNQCIQLSEEIEQEAAMAA